MHEYLKMVEDGNEMQIQEIVTKVTSQEQFINYNVLLDAIPMTLQNSYAFKLLECFQYKQYKDMTEEFTLNNAQKRHFLLLSCLDLLVEQRISYDVFKKNLFLSTDYQVEDVLMTLVERQWAVLKLNQADRIAVVKSSKSRLDPLDHQLIVLETSLEEWYCCSKKVAKY